MVWPRRCHFKKRASREIIDCWQLQFFGNADYDSHSITAGTPGKKLKENVIWERGKLDNIFEDGASLDAFFKENMKSLVSK
ncbi:hypothetical protein KMP13_16495 [Epibacterium ulvae]|uniref:hypothetical protein n=1 Tax=Epibacterium ulvae TaxID=1156985 RepID=UPI001BFCCFDB|nr:hypothetical protein [Epibacterium ulvae]MBT8155440.1 hypothetical protein [Epibacterium ulvae]